MEHLMRYPGEQPEKGGQVEDPQKISTRGFDSQGYTKEIIPLEDRYKDRPIQQFAEYTEQISKKLTTLEKEIPTDLPQLELDEGIQKRIDEYEKKWEEQKLFPALPKGRRGQPPIFWKIESCENRIKYSEKRINSLAKYNNSSKDLEGRSEDLLNLYRYLQKGHYKRFKEDCEVLKNVCLYLFKEHDKIPEYKHEKEIAKYKGSEEKNIEKQYIDLKKRYSILKSLKKGYNRIEDLSKNYKKADNKDEGTHKDLEEGEHNKDIIRRHENLRDLEKNYQHKYQDPYENLEEHLKHLKGLLRNLETKRYTYLEKNLKDLKETFEDLIKKCTELNIEHSKYLKETLEDLIKDWEKLEKHDGNLEERCKILEEHWKDFVESSKTAYLPDNKLIREKMVTQEKELSKILDVYNDKRKELMKLKHTFEDKLKELHTTTERSQKPETSSYQDDSHSAPIENLTRRIDKLEKFLDDKREIIHRELKKLSFHLKGNLLYFLEKQKHNTDFYSKNSSLLHLAHADLECGIACTVMVADSLKSWEGLEKLLQNFAEVYPEVLREDAKGLTATYTYPIVLKRIRHHINYEYAKIPDIAKKKYATPETNAEWDGAYRSHMGKDPKEITLDDFKSAIGQKDKDGKVIPVIASITMDFHKKCYHAIILDGWDKTPEGEELLVVRDIHTELSPDTGKPLTNNQGRLWKDFMEVWTGVAIIPTIESDPNETSSSQQTDVSKAQLHSTSTNLERSAALASQSDPSWEPEFHRAL